MSTSVTLPRWDMTVVYPSLQSPEFEADLVRAQAELNDLAEFFDRQAVGAAPAPAIDAQTVQTFDEAVRRLSAVEERLHTIGAYVYAFVSTDSRDNLAQARRSEIEPLEVRLTQLLTRFVAWVGSLDVEELLQQSSLAPEYEYLLRTARVQAEHLMPLPEEDLAAELDMTGGSAWARLHSTMSSQLMVPIELDGERRDEPMSVIRNLAFVEERDVRRRAYEAELAAWERVAVPMAAALNSIKGESITLERRRHWTSPLDAAVFDNHIDRQTLDAMMDAARESFPEFRRYLHAKARALGVPVLAWYDLFAPVGKSERAWEWEDATAFLADQFGTYSQRLRAFAERALHECWIDAEPRPGKEGGAFCMWVRGDESRVLANFQPTYDGMSTLAHELGHAYHNLNLAQRSILQRNTPMTLAETASTFCETIVRNAALANSAPREQLVILEAALQDATQIVVDITSRFLFESWTFERREQRELSVEELNELMLESQRQTYGDGLDQAQLHPYMWAVKGHYYGSNFYNFPYMFGLLFGTGLYAEYRKDPERFQAGYDRLLSRTGMADAAPLAADFGIDIRTPEFWRSSLAIITGEIDRFEALVDAKG